MDVTVTGGHTDPAALVVKYRCREADRRAPSLLPVNVPSPGSLDPTWKTGIVAGRFCVDARHANSCIRCVLPVVSCHSYRGCRVTQTCKSGDSASFA